MVNTANQIDARQISQHPLAGGEMDVFPVMAGEATFLACLAIVGGVIIQKKGTERFNAGDYIVSDDPPTNAWKVNREAFLATYRSPGEERPPHTVPGSAAPDLAARAADKTVADKQKAAKAAAKPKTRGPGPKMRMPNTPSRPAARPKRKGAIKAPPK